MRSLLRLVFAFILVMLLLGQILAQDDEQTQRPARAAFITVEGLIDEGLYESLSRRSNEALARDFDYLIFEIDTYGGLIDAADNISMLILEQVNPHAHTAAFVNTRAISAGALVASACETIIMHRNGLIGDAAPIQMGARLEGVEREKAESFVRSLFSRAAQANDHPEALLHAMVTIGIELDAILNTETERYEFFAPDQLPDDAEIYDLDSVRSVVSDNELLTLTASDSEQLGLAEQLLSTREDVLEYLGRRDGVVFAPEPVVFMPNWSEQMVRWVNSPAIMSILVLLALLGAYIELSSPGFGLPGAVALVCVVIIVGSRYLTGLANWLDVAALVVGISLIMVELFVLPGFGVAGIAGFILTFIGIVGMFIRYEPGEIPWPLTDMDWYSLQQGVLGLSIGVFGFLVVLWLLAKHMPRVKAFSGLQLEPTPALGIEPAWQSAQQEGPGQGRALNAGDKGVALTALRPVGMGRFGDEITDVVAAGDFIAKDSDIVITEIYGNRVVVDKIETSD